MEKALKPNNLSYITYYWTIILELETCWNYLKDKLWQLGTDISHRWIQDSYSILFCGRGILRPCITNSDISFYDMKFQYYATFAFNVLFYTLLQSVRSPLQFLRFCISFFDSDWFKRLRRWSESNHFKTWQYYILSSFQWNPVKMIKYPCFITKIKKVRELGGFSHFNCVLLFAFCFRCYIELTRPNS